MRIILLIMIGLSFLKAEFIRDDLKSIVIDTSTNLIWQDDANVTSVDMNWSEAITHCEDMSLGGYSDWHLPNYNELYMLADRSKINPAISDVFQNTNSSYFWSSTTFVSAPSSAWDVYFYDGLGNWLGKTNADFVRCVRPSDN